eukprot:gene3209-5525_t
MEQSFVEVLKLIQKDIGNRGINHLINENNKQDFYSSCKVLSKAKSVGIVTGAFVHKKACETDGPLGAFSIAKTLIHLKKRVIFIVDSSNQKIIEDFLSTSEITVKCSIYSFSSELNPILNQNDEKLSLKILEENELDCLVTIERFGKSQDGKYYSMKAMDLSNSCGNIDLLFEMAKKKKIPTISIGDGGNEIGMGKVIEKVKKYINNGEVIAASCSADYLIIVGVSNWGGLAISSGLFLLDSENEQPVKLNDYLLTVEEEFQLLKDLVKVGSIDGISGQSELTVDGFDYLEVHTKILKGIRNICENK